MSVAIVTGGTRGIGRATVLELARRGFTVVINFRARADLAEALIAEASKLGPTPVAMPADVARPEDVRSLFNRADSIGELGALVCSAGIARDTLLGASTPEDFDAVLATNLGGVVNCCREAARRMASLRRGAIVTVSSVAAQRPGRGQTNYAASKGGVEALTRALAVELAPRQVRVNAVAPGLIRTDMTGELEALAPEELTRRVLLRRLGHPDEVARVIAFLCGDESSYVTGQVWNVDGGFKLE